MGYVQYSDMRPGHDPIQIRTRKDFNLVPLLFLSSLACFCSTQQSSATCLFFSWSGESLRALQTRGWWQQQGVNWDGQQISLSMKLSGIPSSHNDTAGSHLTAAFLSSDSLVKIKMYSLVFSSSSSVKCLECSVLSVTAMIPNLMLHVLSNTSFITPAVIWSTQAPLGVPQYLLKSFLSHQPFIPFIPQRDPTLHRIEPTCEFSQTRNLLCFLISQEPGYLWNDTSPPLIGQPYSYPSSDWLMRS